MEKLLIDARYAARMLLKAPGYTAITVLILGLGIGANAAIFSLLNAALLSPLPGIAEPDRMIMIGRTAPSGPYASSREFDTLSYPNFIDLRDQAKHLEGVAGYSSTLTSVTTPGNAEMLTVEMVSGSYFDVLRVVPVRGRLLRASDEDSDTTVAVIGYGLWQRLGARDDEIGSTIHVGGQPVTVVGVTSRGFNGLDATAVTDVWVPLPMQSALMMGNFNYLTSPNPRRMAWLQVVGRMKPGMKFNEAKAEVDSIGRRLTAAYPEDNLDTGLVAVAGVGLDPGDREQITRFGAILLGAVGLVLLLACTNVANLMLARASGRWREVAVRVALGASRSRVVQQFLTESTLLATIGGAFGLILSSWMSAGLRRLSPGAAVPLPAEIRIDARVLGFTVVVSLAAGLLFGLAPAIQSFVRDLVSTLKQSSAQASAARSRVRSTLVLAEVSLSLVLLVSAGLLMKTLLRFQQVDPGFRTRNLVMFSMFPALEGYDEAHSRQLYDETQRALQAVPGVQAVTASRVRPLNPGGWGTSYEVQDLSKEHRSAQFNTVEPNYFEVMGIGIVEGRSFSSSDKVASPLVAVVNQTMARRLWPAQSALGKHIKVGNDQEWREIVGVARDVKMRTLNEAPQPYLYLPMSQPMPFWRSSVAIEIKTDLPAPLVLAAAKKVVQALDPRLPLYSLRTLSQQFEYSYWQQRMAAWLIGVFAGLALLLAGVGVYGVISWRVAERTRELGIRMALGAQRTDVLQNVLRGAIVLAGSGVALGAAAGLVLARALKSLLFGVSASDPLIFVFAALVLSGVAIVASLVPALRAARLDPIVALRHE